MSLWSLSLNTFRFDFVLNMTFFPMFSASQPKSVLYLLVLV